MTHEVIIMSVSFRMKKSFFVLLSQEQDLQYCKTHKQQHSVSLFGLFGHINTADMHLNLNSPCYCGALNKWKMSPDRLTMKWCYFSPPALSLPVLVVCVFLHCCGMTSGLELITPVLAILT